MIKERGNATIVWVLLGLLSIGAMVFIIWRFRNQYASPFSSTPTSAPDIAPKKSFQELLATPTSTPEISQRYYDSVKKVT